MATAQAKTRTTDTRSQAADAGENDEILLGVLSAIERDSNISQRTISREIGVALGLANAYLKRCARKGLIKIQQVPRKRYAYYLTPQGFAEKARLTGQYLSASFTFFRRARAQLSDLIATCTEAGHRRIAIAGISDLAEVAILCAADHKLTFVGVIDRDHAGTDFHGIRVFPSAAQCGDVDAVIVTAMKDPSKVFSELTAELGKTRVFAPAILHILTADNPEAKSTS